MPIISTTCADCGRASSEGNTVRMLHEIIHDRLDITVRRLLKEPQCDDAIKKTFEGLSTTAPASPPIAGAWQEDSIMLLSSLCRIYGHSCVRCAQCLAIRVKQVLVKNLPKFDAAKYEETEEGDTVDKAERCAIMGQSVLRWSKGTSVTFPKNVVPVERFPISRLVGVELEAFQGGDGDLTDKVEQWKGQVVMDGSVGNGYEIRTPPSAGKHFIEMIEAICAAAAEAHSVVNARCGLHVHVDARDFSPKDLVTLSYLWCLFEPQFFAMMPASRRGQNQTTHTWYCKPVSSRWRVMQTWFDPKKHSPDNQLSYISGGSSLGREIYSGQRYKALNLAAFNRHNTVEIRLHSGTLMADKIIPWALICASLAHAVKTVSAKELIKITTNPNKPTRDRLFDLIPSQEARDYVIKRQKAFAAINTPDSLSRLFNPAEEYTQFIHSEGVQ